MKLAPEEITTMQVLEQAATAGPWPIVVKGNSIQSQSIAGVCSGISLKTGNAAFISAARDFVPRAIEHIRFTEASTQEALAILDEAAALPSERQDEAMRLIDWAAQKLRGVRLSEEDAELVALAKKYPVELPWMQAAPMVVVGTPNQGPSKCSPLSCDGCPACEVQVAQGLPVEKGGEANG